MKQKTDMVYSNSVCTHYAPPSLEVCLCVVDLEALHCIQPYTIFLTLISGFSSCFLSTIHCTPPCYILLFCIAATYTGNLLCTRL